MEIQTISSPVWISRIVPSNPFRLFFLWHCVVSSHTCTDQYSEGRSLAHFQSSFFLLFSLFWYSALQILVTVAYQDTNSISSTPGRPQGSTQVTPSVAFWTLPPDSILGQSHGSPCLSLFFQGLVTSAPWCPVSENIVLYIWSNFYFFKMLDKVIPCYSTLAKIALPYFDILKQYVDLSAKFFNV